MENTETVRRMSSRASRSTTKSRNVSNKSIVGQQHSEKVVDKQKPIVQQCLNQLENKDWCLSFSFDIALIIFIYNNTTEIYLYALIFQGGHDKGS